MLYECVSVCLHWIGVFDISTNAFKSIPSLFFQWMRWLHFLLKDILRQKKMILSKKEKKEEERFLPKFVMTNLTRCVCACECVHRQMQTLQKASWVTNHYKLSSKFFLCVCVRVCDCLSLTHSSILCVWYTFLPFHLQCVYDTLGRMKSHFRHTLHYSIFLYWSMVEKPTVHSTNTQTHAHKQKWGITPGASIHFQEYFIDRFILFALRGIFTCCDKNMAFFCCFGSFYTHSLKWLGMIGRSVMRLRFADKWQCQRETTLLHIDVNEKNLNGKVPRKRFSKDHDAKQKREMESISSHNNSNKTANKKRADKKTNFAMPRFAFFYVFFLVVVPVLIGSRCWIETLLRYSVHIWRVGILWLDQMCTTKCNFISTNLGFLSLSISYK